MRDSARVGIFLARTVPSGDGVELAKRQGAAGDVGGRDFQTLLPLRSARQARRRCPAPRGRFPPSRGAAAPTSEPDGGARSATSRNALDLSGVMNTASEAGPERPAPALIRAPGLRRASSPARAGRSCGRSPTASAGAYLYNGPQLGFSIPELFVEFELALPGLPRIRGVSAPGVPVIGHRPQRPRRLGLHLGPLRRGRPVRREGDRARRPTASTGGAGDGLPRRDLHLAAPAHRPARGARGADPGSSGPAARRGHHRAHLPHASTARSSPPATGSRSRALRDLGPRARDDRRHRHAQPGAQHRRGRRGDGRGHLERERDRRRRPRQHRLLASRAAPAAAPALGRAPAVPGHGQGGVARAVASIAHPAVQSTRVRDGW